MAVKCYNPRPSPMDVPAKLLALAASVSWDGGDDVLRVLREILKEDAPFDAGEVALQRSPGFQRWTLTDDPEMVAADDLLERASAADLPIRIDDILEVRFAPRARERLIERGLRSCLVIPLSGAGGPEGAIVVAREHGWAFAGVSLHTLWPVASMAGLCLARAVALTALKRDADAVRVSSRAHEEELRKTLSTLEDEAHGLRRALEQAQEAKAVSLADLTGAEERAGAAMARAEGLGREAQEWRSEAERLAGVIRDVQELAETRTAELASAIQRLAEVDRKLAERERELELVPPPPAKRRRRPRSEPEPSSGNEPGPSSGS
jgi:hypothetical protein